MSVSNRLKKIAEKTKNINKKVKICRYKSEISLEKAVTKHSGEDVILVAIYVGEYVGTIKS